MLTLGWIVPLFVAEPQRGSWHFWRALAAAPVMIWGLIDAVWAWLNHDAEGKEAEILADVYEVLRELETMAVKRNVALRLSECGVRVWRVGRRSLKDRWSGETRAPLIKIASSPFHLPSHSSGLSWRVGMGVIGVSVEKNSPAAVDVAQAWEDLSDDSENQWNTLPGDRQFGLTYAEFHRLARPTASGPRGPFVLAVPYYRGTTALGVASLDMAGDDAQALDLGGVFDDPDQRVVQLLYACVKRAFDS